MKRKSNRIVGTLSGAVTGILLTALLLGEMLPVAGGREETAAEVALQYELVPSSERASRPGGTATPVPGTSAGESELLLHMPEQGEATAKPLTTSAAVIPEEGEPLPIAETEPTVALEEEAPEEIAHQPTADATDLPDPNGMPSVTDSGLLSPAMAILGEQLRFDKSGLLNRDIGFSPSEFDLAAGMKVVSSITVLSLPEAAVGSLYLGDQAVKLWQVIPRAQLEKLHFVPCCTVPADCSFTYGMVGSSGRYEVECGLHLLSELNFAPTVSLSDKEASVMTHQNVSYFGRLSGSDPEGDACRFEITRYPHAGVLSLDPGSGAYCYQPSAGYTGNDRFRYVCIDRYGGRSAENEVHIKVQRNQSGIFYSDLRDHPAGNAAIALAEKGIMTGKTVAGSYLFDPDGSITRAEFLTVLLSGIESRPADGNRLSEYADGNEVSTVCRGMVSAAIELGLLPGDAEGEEKRLRPNAPITRSEAVSILTRLVFGEAVETGGTDAGSGENKRPSPTVISAAAVQKLEAGGFLADNGQPSSSSFTRADTALCLQILLEDR